MSHKGHGRTLNAYYKMKGYVEHDSNYMTSWKWQNYEESKKISSHFQARGWGKGGGLSR